jgi:hypothetical protein
MALKEQIEEIVGREILVFYADQLAELQGVGKREAMSLIDRNTRVVPITDVLARRDVPKGPLAFVISEFRGGFLIRLLEVV